MKKWIILLVIVLVGLGIWLWLRSDQADDVKKEVADKLKPTVDVASVQITDFDGDKVRMKVRAVLHNPFPVEITTKRLDYEVFIDTVNVIKDAYGKPITVRSGDSTVLTIPLELQGSKTAGVVRRLEKEGIDSVEYSARATFDADVPVAGERTFNFYVSKKMPALRVPEFKLKDVDLNALKLKKEGIDFVLEITNKGPLSFQITNGKFNISAGDHLKMDGMMEPRAEVKAKGKTDIAMHALMTDGNMLKAVWEFLTDKKDAKIDVALTGVLNSENEVLDGSNLNVKLKSTVGDLQKTAEAVKGATEGGKK